GILAGVVIGGGQGSEKLLKGCNGVGRQLGRHVELLMCTVWFSRDVVEEGGGWRGWWQRWRWDVLWGVSVVEKKKRRLVLLVNWVVAECGGAASSAAASAIMRPPNDNLCSWEAGRSLNFKRFRSRRF